MDETLQDPIMQDEGSACSEVAQPLLSCPEMEPTNGTFNLTAIALGSLLIACQGTSAPVEDSAEQAVAMVEGDPEAQEILSIFGQLGCPLSDAPDPEIVGAELDGEVALTLEALCNAESEYAILTFIIDAESGVTAAYGYWAALEQRDGSTHMVEFVGVSREGNLTTWEDSGLRWLEGLHRRLGKSNPRLEWSSMTPEHFGLPTTNAGIPTLPESDEPENPGASDRVPTDLPGAAACNDCLATAVDEASTAIETASRYCELSPEQLPPNQCEPESLACTAAFVSKTFDSLAKLNCFVVSEGFLVQAKEQCAMSSDCCMSGSELLSRKDATNGDTRHVGQQSFRYERGALTQDIALDVLPDLAIGGMFVYVGSSHQKLSGDDWAYCEGTLHLYGPVTVQGYRGERELDDRAILWVGYPALGE